MNKKIRQILSCFTLSIVVLSAVPQIVKADGKNKVTIGFRQTIDIPKDSAEEIYNELKDVMNETYWEFNHSESRFERIVNYEDLKVKIGDNVYTTDESGSVELSVDDSSLSKLDIVVEGDSISQELKQTINPRSNDTSIVFDMDVSKMINMNDVYREDNASRASSTNPYWSNGELGTTGKRLHCNRWNGTRSDNRYYTNSDASWNTVKASKNFIGSDCDRALLKTMRCIREDYGPNPWCAAKPESKQASCSKFIGHSNRFHSHKI